MPLNTGSYALPYQMAPLQDPTTKPLIFNYANGDTLAPHSSAQGYADGMNAFGKAMGGAIQQVGQKAGQAIWNANNPPQTPEQQAQAWALSQQALQMLQPQQPQGMSGFNGLVQQVAPNQNQ